MKMKSKVRFRTLDELSAAYYKTQEPDIAALTRRSEDIALELHALGNELHKARLHRQGTAADVAVGILEDITEDLKNGG